MPNEECCTVIILFVRFHIELNREIEFTGLVCLIERRLIEIKNVVAERITLLL